MGGVNDDEKLIRFLKIIRTSNWRSPPKVWNEQLRRSLSDDLVTVGFGGVLELTNSGHAAIADPTVHSKGAM